MVLLCAIALIISALLCVHALSGQGLIGCTAGTSCNQVLGSRWSFLFGIIPVSGLAFCLYVVLLFCLVCADRMQEDPAFGSLLWKVTAISAGAITGSAIWFIWLQKNFIRAFCPYCMTAHITGLILSVLIVIYIHIENKVALTFRRVICYVLGLLLACGMAGVQLCTTPRTAFERGFVEEALPQEDPHELPVIGNPDARYCVTLLFDYQCSHCQKIHSLLPEVVRHFNGEVAFVLCPTPLSQECNPYVPSGEDRFKGSCELAKISLALWRTDRQAFKQFDAWLFEPDPVKGWYPRSVEDAYAKAALLSGRSTSGTAGGDALGKAMNDSWIDNYLSTTFELFGRTSQNGKAAIPRFIYNSQWIIPDADDATGLESIISKLCFDKNN